MIRTKHDIDTKLVNFFISEKNFDDNINESLLNWYNSLEFKDQQITRDNAIKFLKKIAFVVLNEVNYPFKERNDLIATFEPLEKLLRTAVSLKDSGGGTNIRDHLSHTVRNVLFTNYLLKRYYTINNSSRRMQLFIASIFHDIAYPIQKIKEVAHMLGDAAFKNLLNSKGEIEIELNNPDDLLNMLDFFGRAKNHLEKEIADLIKSAIEKGIDNNLEIKNIEKVIQKVEHIYRNIISKAIAGKGLFDSSHSISSIVLFLIPIIKYWRDSKPYQEMNLNKICDVCLAMAYHDRGNLISDIPFKVIDIVRIMRISDELQEWDRETDSFIKDVIILNDVSSVLSLKIVLKNKLQKDCKPELFITDKIIGLVSVVENETIKILFETPGKLTLDKLKAELAEKKEIEEMYSLNETKSSSQIQLIFHNNNVQIDFVK